MDTIYKALRDRGIAIDRGLLTNAEDSDDQAQAWAEEYLSEATLLTQEELDL